MTKEYDLAEIVKDPVDAIIAKFDDLDDTQLATLRDLELDNKGRVTLLTAIDSTRASRDRAAIEAASKTVAEISDAGPVLAGAQDAQADPVLVQAAQDAADAQAKHIGELEATITALTGERDALRASNAQSEQDATRLQEQLAAANKDLFSTREDVKARDEHIADLENQVRSFGRAPVTDQVIEDRTLKADSRVEHFRHVAFGDEHDNLLTQIVPLAVNPEQLETLADGAIILNMDIDFPLFGLPNDVRSVWLVSESGKSGRRCRLMAPLQTGGGKSARIPSGHLRFDAPAPAKAA